MHSPLHIYTPMNYNLHNFPFHSSPLLSSSPLIHQWLPEPPKTVDPVGTNQWPGRPPGPIGPSVRSRCPSPSPCPWTRPSFSCSVRGGSSTGSPANHCGSRPCGSSTRPQSAHPSWWASPAGSSGPVAGSGWTRTRCPSTSRRSRWRSCGIRSSSSSARIGPGPCYARLTSGRSWPVNRASRRRPGWREISSAYVPFGLAFSQLSPFIFRFYSCEIFSNLWSRYVSFSSCLDLPRILCSFIFYSLNYWTCSVLYRGISLVNFEARLTPRKIPSSILSLGNF